MARNPITIEVLETLDAIDRRGSFAKAAEELNKATSAVSYIIQKLEEQLDIAVFQRQGRRSVLTPAGQLILSEGREILQFTARLASKALEVANGWETRIRIAVESLQPYPLFFKELEKFLQQHSSIEVDICESVLNGGWDALEQDKVDLLVGAPGPVPYQKGYRAIIIEKADLVPVVASRHELAEKLSHQDTLEEALRKVRRVVTHDTSIINVTRSAGFGDEGKKLYVQNIDQKVEAILAGLGIGHLPRHRIHQHLDSGELTAFNLDKSDSPDACLAWKISNRGKGLIALTKQLSAAYT